MSVVQEIHYHDRYLVFEGDFSVFDDGQGLIVFSSYHRTPLLTIHYDSSQGQLSCNIKETQEVYLSWSDRQISLHRVN